MLLAEDVLRTLQRSRLGHALQRKGAASGCLLDLADTAEGALSKQGCLHQQQAPTLAEASSVVAKLGAALRQLPHLIKVPAGDHHAGAAYLDAHICSRARCCCSAATRLQQGHALLRQRL